MFKWTFGETTISHVKIWNHPIESNWNNRLQMDHFRFQVAAENTAGEALKGS